MPVLELFFSLDCKIYIIKCFEIYKLFEFIFTGKTFNQFMFMLIDPSPQIICYSYVKDRIGNIGDDIDMIVARIHWDNCIQTKILKQVQDDVT